MQRGGVWSACPRVALLPHALCSVPAPSSPRSGHCSIEGTPDDVETPIELWQQLLCLPPLEVAAARVAMHLRSGPCMVAAPLSLCRTSVRGPAVDAKSLAHGRSVERTVPQAGCSGAYWRVTSTLKVDFRLIKLGVAIRSGSADASSSPQPGAGKPGGRTHVDARSLWPKPACLRA